MKWRYKLQHWLEGSGQCHTLATLSHTQRASGSHFTESCMSLSSGLGVGAWIPPRGTEPKSVIIQPISIPLSILLVGQIQPLNIFVLMNSVFGICSQKAKVTCLQTLCRSLGIKSELQKNGSLNLMSYIPYQVINVLLFPQLWLQTDWHALELFLQLSAAMQIVLHGYAVNEYTATCSTHSHTHTHVP
jgi:hypothetical protein